VIVDLPGDREIPGTTALVTQEVALILLHLSTLDTLSSVDFGWILPLFFPELSCFLDLVETLF
jgi:hypothetical protein